MITRNEIAFRVAQKANYGYLERAFNHHAWLRTSHVPLNSNTPLARRSLNAVTACVGPFFTPPASPFTRRSLHVQSYHVELAALPIDASTWRSQPMHTEQGHPTNSTTRNVLRARSYSPGRLAVCMVGGLRTLIQPTVFQSIKANLLDSQVEPVDLFINTHLKVGSGDMSLNRAGGSPVAADDPRLLAAISHLKPVQYVLRRTNDCSQPEVMYHRVCQDKRVPSNDVHLHGYLQFLWIVEAHHDVLR